jgi:hypothetical protein
VNNVFADPPPDLPDVPFHRHFIVSPDGSRVQVGPDLCTNPELQDAFNQFHYNIHMSALPGLGAIPTKGPQGGAPGLHDQQGAELVAAGCE